MAIKNRKEYRRARIKLRIRKRISGTADRPRMTVFRSNKEIYVQFIDDLNGNTMAAASSTDKTFQKTKGTKIEIAKQVGKLAAENALNKGISSIVFDRNGYLYHGRVKALADAARENGLKF